MTKNASAIRNELFTDLQDVYDGVTFQPYAGGYRVAAEWLPKGFKFEIRTSGNGVFLRVWAGPALTGMLKSSRYEEFYAATTYPQSWRAPSEVAPGAFPDTVVSEDPNELITLAMEVINWALENVTEVAPTVGVSFVGTNFEGYGERDFMASVVQIQKLGFATFIPSVGTKLGFEYVAPSTNSRIDAVEFNENDEVITVIECQSGIQHGAYLDDEHFAKAISRYPQSAEVANTVKKIVVIAGGYAAEQLATFKQLPYEIVALQTVASNGQISLETVAY